MQNKCKANVNLLFVKNSVIDYYIHNYKKAQLLKKKGSSY